ncbi:hypothetical protein DXV76_07755 [Rhodobacteraceae bacterium CCMM004]|nr:hypothetical protein DXV76_07755 [Rhodobacteraceae bacterium CCMM004]
MDDPTTPRSTATTGAIAAALNAAISVAMAGVAMLWIGPEAMRGSDAMAELARTVPAPIVVQDMLKIASAAVSLALILALALVLAPAPDAPVRATVIVGLAAETALLANAALSLAAVVGAAPAGMDEWMLTTAIAALVVGGAWLILVNVLAWRRRRLPTALCLCGLLAGAAALAVPLSPLAGFASLVLGVIWSASLAGVLWSHRAAP